MARPPEPGEGCTWCDRPAVVVAESPRWRGYAGCVRHTFDGKPRQRMPNGSRGADGDRAYQEWYARQVRGSAPRRPGATPAERRERDNRRRRERYASDPAYRARRLAEARARRARIAAERP